MNRVFTIVQKIFDAIFTKNYFGGNYPTVISRFIYHIKENPYLCIGVILLIVGSCVGYLKRIIHS